MSPDDPGTAAAGQRPPHDPPLRLVRGDPTAEEVAALVAVLSSAGGGDDPEAKPRPRSAWASRASLVRRPVSPGPGGWRASALPR